MNRILQQDIQKFAELFVLADQIENATFLVTGATGLIGSTLAHCLLALKREVRIVAPIRDYAKAKSMYSEGEMGCIDFVVCDITNYDYEQLGDVDFIIHCAAPTASRYFVEHPVETADIIYNGTKTLLDYAKTHRVKGFVYLSSLEVYGEIHDEGLLLTEDMQGYLDTLSVRSSYPMAKRAAENMCCLYASEYGVPVRIARLTQTTGAGIAKDDNRIIAQFARLASQGEDIVLHTIGESARPYCYTMDCVSAILFILLKGISGEAYNVANEETYISAYDLGEFAKKYINPNIDVRIELNENMGYAPPTKQNLATGKLQSLGWKPKYDLKMIFERLAEYLSS